MPKLKTDLVARITDQKHQIKMTIEVVVFH